MDTSDVHDAAPLGQRLGEALERQAFELYYQPIVDLGNGRICGAEALLRWSDGGAWIPPQAFVPSAEASGLIVPLGLWVLHEACRQAVAWKRAGLEVRIAVNVSPRQLEQGDFVESAFDTFDATGAAPGLIELEITETSLMKDVDAAARKLQRLVDRGTQLSIDDFGTGYASLGYLRRLPAATLKIDQSFVRDLDQPKDMKIVTAIIGLAQSLGLSTVAEGVETAAQYEFLRALGCEQCQGYLISEPLPAHAMAALLAQSRNARPACSTSLKFERPSWRQLSGFLSEINGLRAFEEVGTSHAI